MFQMEFNADNKMDILTASSLVGDDRNVWALLEAALSLSQPPEVRAEAAAFAVARNPDLLLSHFNDPDLLVQLEIQNSFILTAQPSKINSGFPTISLENLPPSQPRSN